MKNKAFFVFFFFFSFFLKGFAELVIDKMSVRENSFYLSVKTFPPAEVNHFTILEGGNTLQVGYDIRVFKKGDIFEWDMFLTNIQIRYEIKKDYLNNGYVANVWYGGDFAYKRWFENNERLLRFLYRLDNFRAFSFTQPKETDFFYLEVSQFFDSYTHQTPQEDIIGRFLRSILGLRYEFAPVRSKVFNKNGIRFE